VGGGGGRAIPKEGEKKEEKKKGGGDGNPSREKGKTGGKEFYLNKLIKGKDQKTH